MTDNEDEPRGMPPATGVFLVLNGVIFVLLAISQGDLSFSPRTIAGWGGLLPREWLDGEYWRLLSYGFLHFGVLHLIVNATCLLAWGVPLERLYGSLPLAALYLGSIVLAGAGSILLHEGPFVSAGASGGVSGLLGALFLLRIVGHIGLPVSFFVINFGLNIGIALFVPGIDWQAHLAGLLGGIALAALLLLPGQRGPR